MYGPMGKPALESGTEQGIIWATLTAPLYGVVNGCAVNGYALLPDDHPWRDLDLQMGYEGPDVHGGITYGPDADGWIGFDFLHAGDTWPGQPHRFGDDVLRTPADVQAEATSLARQVAKAMA